MTKPFQIRIRKADQGEFRVAGHLRDATGKPIRIRFNPIRNDDEEYGTYGDPGYDLVVVGLPSRIVLRPPSRHLHSLDDTLWQIKWKPMSFATRDEYPYDTVFLDGLNKPIVDFYGIVNKDATGMLVVDTYQTEVLHECWTARKNLADNTKEPGTRWSGHQCPKSMANFVPLHQSRRADWLVGGVAAYIRRKWRLPVEVTLFRDGGTYDLTVIEAPPSLRPAVQDKVIGLIDRLAPTPLHRRRYQVGIRMRSISQGRRTLAGMGKGRIT
jgi:hypothetical protein